MVSAEGCQTIAGWMVGLKDGFKVVCIITAMFLIYSLLKTYIEYKYAVPPKKRLRQSRLQ